MSNNTKAIAKLKKKSRKYPPETGLSGLRSSLLQILPAVIVLWLLRKFLIESDYMLKRESTKFFRFGSNAYGSNKGRKCDRMLIIAFGLIDREFDADYVALIRNAVRLTLKNSKIRLKYSEKILTSTRRLEIMTLDAGGWYQLSRGLFSLGYFRAAWVARENSLDLSIDDALKTDASSIAVERSLQAYFERRDYEVVRSKLHLCRREDDFKILLDLLSKSFMKDVDECSKYVDGEKVFNKCIRDKNIALVGAGIQDGFCGAEIDSADTVFRVRFSGAEFLQQMFVGSRCDIAQYNDTSAMRDASDVSTEFGFLDCLKCIVVFEDQPAKLRHKPLVNLFFNVPIYRSSATSGLVNLLAVLMNSPAKLKLFGFDFYSRLLQYDSALLRFYAVDGWKFGQTYKTVYKDGALSRSVIALSFVAHDPVSNFCFAQNLYKAGLFDIEPYGKSILELTPYQYVERLEEMLGDW